MQATSPIVWEPPPDWRTATLLGELMGKLRVGQPRRPA